MDLSLYRSSRHSSFVILHLIFRSMTNDQFPMTVFDKSGQAIDR
jgi:hypothetical protein